MRAKLTAGTSEVVLKEHSRDYLIYLNGTYGMERSDFSKTSVSAKHDRITFNRDCPLIDKTSMKSETLIPAAKW